MRDSTVYAGISPDTGKAMDAPAADAPLFMDVNKAISYAFRLAAYGHTDSSSKAWNRRKLLHSN